MGGGGAAAPPDDFSPRPDQGQALLGKVIRLAPVYHPAAQHRGIPGIGHGAEEGVLGVQPPDLSKHMLGAAHAVEAGGVHPFAGLHSGKQLGAPQTLPGIAVRLHPKGHQQEGGRAQGLELPGKIRHPLVGGQGFQQEMGDPLGEEELGLGQVDRRRVRVLQSGHRSQVPEYIGPIGGGGLPGQHTPRKDCLAGQGFAALLVHGA